MDVSHPPQISYGLPHTAQLVKDPPVNVGDPGSDWSEDCHRF